MDPNRSQSAETYTGVMVRSPSRQKNVTIKVNGEILGGKEAVRRMEDDKEASARETLIKDYGNFGFFWTQAQVNLELIMQAFISKRQ